MSLRPWLANLALAGMGLAAAFCLGELIVRIVPPLARKASARQAALQPQTEVHPRGLYRMDGDTCWTLTPGFSGRFVHPSFDIQVEANGKGLRDRDFPAKAPGTFRILGLGDSFAFGWGVPLEACFFKRLGSLLNGVRPDVVHEVINAGIPGYGTYEALRLLTSVGLGYEPDLVILAFYEGNDYLNNADAPRRRAIVSGYLSDVAAAERRGLTRFALRHSALAALLDEQGSGILEKRAFRASVEKTERYLLEIRGVLAARNVPLVVLFIPDQDAAVYSRPALLRVSDRLLRGEDFFVQRAQLEAFCRAQGIGFCRLSPLFEDHPGSARLRLSPQDSHFNTQGHLLAAEELCAWLSAHAWALEGKMPPTERSFGSPGP
jgi:hypothetical protein